MLGEKVNISEYKKFGEIGLSLFCQFLYNCYLIEPKLILYHELVLKLFSILNIPNCIFIGFLKTIFILQLHFVLMNIKGKKKGQRKKEIVWFLSISLN